LLEPEQIRDFRERGFFQLGRVFDDAELSEIRAEYDRLVEHPMQVGEEGKTPFLYVPLLQLQSPVLRRHASSPRLAEVAVELLGPDVRLYWDQAVFKPAGADSSVPWHQDNGYAPVVPEEYVTFTVAIDATSLENGCLWIQPGSHRHGVRPHRASGSFFYESDAGDDAGVACEQSEGDVLCFSSLTLHRSGPNTSDRPRRSWIVQLCRAETRDGKTGRPLDDRLWVARDGTLLDEPWSERPFDVQAVLEASQDH
jgi:ectoine hydroxylase-related dioxygenase (phytanoyl-CoA dioxygenase family)